MYNELFTGTLMSLFKQNLGLYCFAKHDENVQLRYFI